MTQYETNGDLKSFLQKLGAFYESTDALTSTKKIDIALQIVQGALFLSQQKSVSYSHRVSTRWISGGIITALPGVIRLITCYICLCNSLRSIIGSNRCMP